MGKKFQNILSVFQIALGVLLAAMPFWLVPVCPPMENGKHMVCYYTGIMITIAGALLALIAIINLISKKSGLKKFLTLIQIIVTALTYMVPAKIIPIAIGTNMKGQTKYLSICMKETMSCHTTFMYVSYVLIAMGVILLVHLATQFLSKND